MLCPSSSLIISKIFSFVYSYLVSKTWTPSWARFEPGSLYYLGPWSLSPLQFFPHVCFFRFAFSFGFLAASPPCESCTRIKLFGSTMWRTRWISWRRDQLLLCIFSSGQDMLSWSYWIEWMVEQFRCQQSRSRDQQCDRSNWRKTRWPCSRLCK